VSRINSKELLTELWQITPDTSTAARTCNKLKEKIKVLKDRYGKEISEMQEKTAIEIAVTGKGLNPRYSITRK